MKYTAWYGVIAGCCCIFTAQAQQKPSTLALEKRSIVVYKTAAKTDLRITPTDTLHFTPMGQPLETQVCVFVDPTHRFQTVTGFGGAITDASAEVFGKLPAAQQQELLTAYYDKQKGIGYNLVRTTIASSDFSSGTYAYVQEGDSTLKTFNIDHDRRFRIPLIKAAMKTAGGKLDVFATPWSPPGWMKRNNNVLQGGKLLPQYRQAWANHYVKFIRAYEKEGIPIWGLSVQNEPMATQKWESCIFTGEEERDFIKYFLGPTLQKAGYGSKKLMAWDHNRDLIYQRAATVLNDPAAAKYVWGVAFHWYENWSGGARMLDNVARVHEAFPDKHLMFTEGCIEKFNWDKISDWQYGEVYGQNIISDFNNGTVGWTDWNILLDEQGGPNHVGNFCMAPVHAKNGKLYYSNAFYYIGHFSKFVQAGAKRVAATPSRSKLLSTAFVNPDGKTVVEVMNQSDEEVPFYLWVDGKAAQTSSLPHSMTTFVY
ncbi:MAG TPA: glycoside hydrolase family 30 protein [Chitinophaga sp.]